MIRVVACINHLYVYVFSLVNVHNFDLCLLIQMGCLYFDTQSVLLKNIHRDDTYTYLKSFR